METLGAPRNLYLLSGDDLETLEPLVEEATSVSAAAWSPDSRWLAVSMKPKELLEGLYLVDAAAGEVTLVLGGDFGAPAWLPGGQLAVPVGSDPTQGPKGESGLYIVTLPEDWQVRAGR